MMYYIYKYIDPRTNLPFYIGKGKDTRKYDHIRTKQSRLENPGKANIIKDILEAGLSPIIEEIESNIINEHTAYEREDHYILQYGRIGIDENGILANRTLHGKPPTPIWDDAKKQKHSEFNASYWTDERKAAHRVIAKENAIKGGLASRGMVPVVDKLGNVKKILSTEYRAFDKNVPIEKQEFVSTSSKEGKKRLTVLTLGLFDVNG